MGINCLMKRSVACTWSGSPEPSAPPMEWMYPVPTAIAIQDTTSGDLVGKASYITPIEVNPPLYATVVPPPVFRSISPAESLESARTSRGQGNPTAAIECLLPVVNGPMWGSASSELQTDVYFELGLNYSEYGDLAMRSDRTIAAQSYDFARHFYQQAISLAELPSVDSRFVMLTPYSAHYRLKLVDLGIRQDLVYGEPFADSRLPDWRSRTQEVVCCMGQTKRWTESALTAGSLFVEMSIRMEDGQAANLVVTTLKNMTTFYKQNQAVLSENKRLSCVGHAADILDMVKNYFLDSDAAQLKPLESDLVFVFKDAGMKLVGNPIWQESCTMLRPAITQLWSNPSLKAGKKAMLNSLTQPQGCGCSVS